MRLFIALFLVGTLFGAAHAQCGACIEGICYKKHLLPTPTSRYGALYRKTNTLYHHYRNNDDEEFIIKCDLDTATCNDTARISGAVDLTVDQRTGDIYGTFFENHGIFKLDFENGTKTLSAPVSTVWDLAFKDKLYFSMRDGGGIYAFDNGLRTIFEGTERYDIIKTFIVDKHDDIYFYDYTNNGRFIKKLSKGMIYESGFWDKHDFALSLDKHDNAIFIDEYTHAVYRLNDGKLMDIGAVEWTLKPLFDRDNNLVYYEFNSYNEIEAWHFKHEKNVHCTISNSGSKRIITETVQN